MAATEMNDLMAFIKDSEYGAYPGPGVTKRTQARHEEAAATVDNAPADIRALRGQLPDHFIERLARLAERPD